MSDREELIKEVESAFIHCGLWDGLRKAQIAEQIVDNILNTRPQPDGVVSEAASTSAAYDEGYQAGLAAGKMTCVD